MFRLSFLLAFVAPTVGFAATADQAPLPANSVADEAGDPPASALLNGLMPADFARALLAETNRVRRAHRRWPLRPRRELDAAADDQAAFMALTSQVQHESFLRGQATPSERVRRHGLADVFVAENVAMTSLPTPPDRASVEQIVATLVEQWMQSPGHRENLLNPRLTHFGGSVRLTPLLGHWRAYGVQVFVVESRSTRGVRSRPLDRVQPVSGRPGLN